MCMKLWTRREEMVYRIFSVTELFVYVIIELLLVGLPGKRHLLIIGYPAPKLQMPEPGETGLSIAHRFNLYDFQNQNTFC